MSDSFWLHGLQPASLPCPSLSPRVCSNSYPWVGDAIQYLILCHPLLLLPSIFPSIRIFSNESALHIRWPKYWNFSFNISPSNEYSELTSFRIYWFDLLAVQGTLKSLLQHHSLKHYTCFSVSVLQGSAFSSLTLISVHDCWKTQLLLYIPLMAKWYLCFLIYYPGLS